MLNFKSLSLILGVLIMSLLIVFLVWAWTEPTQAPPGGNVATPLNVSAFPQEKLGSLSFPIFYDRDNPAYYLNPAGDSVLGGNLNMSGKRITNLGAPTASGDAARKADLSGFAKITHGEYTGDDTQNRAIAHGLTTFYWAFILDETSSVLYLVVSGQGYLKSIPGPANYSVTAPNNTNFYVGSYVYQTIDSTIINEVFIGNSNGRVYRWIAFGE